MRCWSSGLAQYHRRRFSSSCPVTCTHQSPEVLQVLACKAWPVAEHRAMYKLHHRHTVQHEACRSLTCKQALQLQRYALDTARMQPSSKQDQMEPGKALAAHSSQTCCQLTCW